MRKIIKLTESDLEYIVKKVLTEQGNMFGTAGVGIKSAFIDRKSYGNGPTQPVNKNINPKGLKLGDGGIKNPQKIKDVKKLQQSLMNLGYLVTNTMTPTGYFGNLTNNALKAFYSNAEPQNKKLKKVEPEIKKPKKVEPEIKNKKINIGSTTCIGLPREMCSKISSTQEVKLGTGNEAQCAAYVTKCLSQYDKDFKAGNAWQSAGRLARQGGTEKFNLFKTNVDWDKIWQGLKANKITKSDCNAFIGKQNSDVGTFKSKSNAILNLSKNNEPDSSGVNWESLKPGDVVGLIHTSTTNKGRAFCERMVDDLYLDDKGNFKQLPFTFNTHVGFVTAIKDGIPIIAHNVGNSLHTKGSYSAVPVTQMLSKSSPDRIVWAYSDPQVESSVQKILNT